jgi:uncharacterized repeat protein (TIGR01451 family)
VFNGTSLQRYTSSIAAAGAVDYVVNAGAYVAMGTSVAGGAGTFTLQNAGTLSLGSPQGITSSGATGNVQVTGSRTFGTAARYIYNGAVLQATGNGLPATVSTLTVANAAGVGLSTSVIISDTLSLLNGVFNIGAATLTLNNIALLTSGSLQSGVTGTVAYNRSADGQPVIQAAYGNLTFSNFKKVLPPSEITIAGSFIPGTAGGHTITGNTINYNGAAQTIAGCEYNNLKTSGSGVKVVSSFGTSTVVDNTLSLLGGSFADSGYTVTVKGSIINNAAHTGKGSILLTGGSAVHVLSGTGSFTNLTLSDGVGASVQNNNLLINGVLTLATGIVATGTNAVVIGTGGSIERATNSSNPRHVFGTITKPIPVNAGTQPILFETGDAVHYTPVDLIFTNVTVAGTLTAAATAGAHPSIGGSGIDAAKCANRYWTLTNAGTIFTSSSINLTFDASDVVPAGASTSAYFMKRFNAAWSLPTLYSRGSFNIRADGVTAFGDFIAGELTDKFHWSGLAGNYQWNDAANWNLLNVPTSSNDVILDGTNADSINVNIAAVCRNMDITNNALVLTIMPSQSLAIGGYLTMSAGRLNTQNLLPSVTGTKSITGGTVGYTSAGPQTIVAWPYFNLLAGGSGAKTASAPLTVNDLSIAGGASLADGGFIISVKGAAGNSGIHSGTGKISLVPGTGPHLLSGTGTYANLELNDANGARIVNGPSINGIFSLTNGIMTSTADTIDIVSPGSVVRTSGYIVGNLQKYVNTTGTVSLTFELGSPAAYLPVAVTLAGVAGAGSITMSSNAGDNADLANSPLSSTLVAHRYWTIANNGITLSGYTAAFQWAPSELQSGITSVADLILAQKPFGASAPWSEAPSASPTFTSIQGTPLTVFGTFQAGKPDTSTFIAITNGDWNVPGTWNKNRVPQPRNGAYIGTPFTVRLTDARSIRLLAVDNGGTFNTNGQTLTLSTTMLLNGTWSGAGTVLWNTATADNFYGTNGVTSGTAVLRITGSNKTFVAAATSLYQIDLSAASSVTNTGSLSLARITGAAAASTFVNAAGASLSVSQDLLATGTLNASASNNTVTYSGTSAQAVSAFAYYHLRFSNAGVKTAGGPLTAAGDLTINSGATFDASAATMTVNGNWTNSGTFIPSTSTVVLAGPAAALVTGATTFATLQVNKQAAGTTVTLVNPVQTGVLAMTQGFMQTGAAAVTITADRTGNGLINGTIVRTQTFVAGTPYAFEGPNNLITFNAGGTLPTSVTETVVSASPGATTYMDPINRYYSLAMTAGTGYTFTYRLHYEDAEIVAPNTKATLKLWHELAPSGSAIWERKGVTAADPVSQNYAEVAGVTAADMGRWSLSSRTLPNLVLTLAQDKNNPAPGDQVTYTITWQNTGDGVATNSLFTASIPANTTFVNGSVAYNAVPTTDYSIALGIITFNLTALNGGNIPAGGTGTITYKVTIN